MNNEYNVWCKWHPLKTVMLGDCYRPLFFRDIKNDKIRSALTRITEETIQDLEHYEQVLKDFGCTVIRPEIDPNESIMDHISKDGQVAGVPKSPLQPRDSQFVLGKTLYFTGRDAKPIFQSITSYNHLSVGILDLNNNPPAPSYTVVGKDLYVDSFGHGSASIAQRKSFSSLPKNIRINTLSIDGHNDGCFHTLKPGAILSLLNIQHYQETFPGWDVCYLPDQSWHKVQGFTKMKNKVGGKWWVPGEEDNDDLIHFVETWLNDWVGYCEESVFDVNVLMLDDKHVCVSNYNEDAFAFFKKHKIEPIIVPWRHRYFWDGGLHCITLDLYRQGEMEDYFPDRSEPIVDLGFD